MEKKISRNIGLIRFGLASAVLVVLFGLSGCASVGSGMAGVEWTPSRGTLNKVLGEGDHLVSPFSEIYYYDLREEEQQETLDVLASNGLAIKLDVSVLFQPVGSELYQLQTQIGPQYYYVLIRPLLSSTARKIIGRYTPEEIYSTSREEIEREIYQGVKDKISGRGVQLNAVLIRDVHLPQIVQAAIDRKLQEEQRALEMKFVLDRERQEADRKRIEAAGIADYQDIINKGLTDKILRWKELEAVEKLSESPNAKTIILGGGGKTPLIVNP